MMSKIANNWYVITGAPSSGKTTLIKLLQKKGFQVEHETARAYIDKQIAEGRTIHEIRNDEMDFQKKVLELKIAVEKKLSKNDVIFFDRGITDSAVYYALYGAGEDIFLKKAVSNCSYKKVFLLDRVGHEKDYARTENDEQAERIHNLLLATYRNLPFPLMTVPLMGLEERLAYVLKNL